MSFEEVKVKIPFGIKFLDAVISVPMRELHMHVGVVVTHGAGGDLHFRHLVSMATSLASNGVLCVRFTCKGLNLSYRTKAYRAVVDYISKSKDYKLKGLFLGGRSMGARAAAATAADPTHLPVNGIDIRGLIFLSYPLHPAKEQKKLRTSDLVLLHQPVLFISGTADEMCEKSLLDDVIRKLAAPTTVHWIEGANHGMGLKGRTEDDVMDEMNTHVLAWIKEVCGGSDDHD
ncbi:testis-expressed protein 30 [Erpetoichthys calabaricus]|uniref:Testis expressed 30 n=1 Tax=Erpetoichthys calabaricus TaxID=27687 RepID=A0A8C4RVP9_ERPCA|nr:testis-expressed protein 30 [Erpetoichthys calabaricus]